MSEVELHVHEHQVLPRFELRLKESESFVITNYTIGPCMFQSKLSSRCPLTESTRGVLRIPKCAHLPGVGFFWPKDAALTAMVWLVDGKQRA